jgi:hypothetical protein
VERVLNELPQEQVAVISSYLGWIPSFMANLVRSCRYLVTGYLIYPGARHRMFESIEKTGHNHALPETDRESYLQLEPQASTAPDFQARPPRISRQAAA